MTPRENHTSNRWSLANILTVLIMSGACYQYANSRYENIMSKLNENASKNEVINERLNGYVDRLRIVEKWQDKAQTYFDKPKQIKTFHNE